MIVTKPIPDQLLLIQERFKGTFIKKSAVYTMCMPPHMGAGYIRYTPLHSGLKILNFDMVLKEDIDFTIDAFTTETIQFLYGIKGSIINRFTIADTAEKVILIEDLQTGLIYSKERFLNTLLLKKETPLIFHMIYIDHKENSECFSDESDCFMTGFREIIHHMEATDEYFYSGDYNLKVAEQFKLLENPEHTSEASEFLSQKGRYYLILAHHIDQLYSKIQNPGSSHSGLLKKELQKILELSDHIKKYPEIQHSIKTLHMTSGLSPAKLQKGFKFIFDRTVSDFIRNIRIEKAEFLMRTTELNISEIVYSIGFTSRSYFCKIFKHKHRCSPKEYKAKSTTLPLQS